MQSHYFSIKSLTWAALLTTALLLSGCDSSQESPSDDEHTLPPALSDTEAHAVSNAAWQTLASNLAEVLQSTQRLQTQITQLISDPTDEHLQQARTQWHHAHNLLQQSAPLFALGNINPGLFQQLQHSHQLIDAFPIQPGYLDYFDVYQHSGIVNDISVSLTDADLRHQHGFSDSTDVSLGFHAIAYLLWGEDQQRPTHDFLLPETLSKAQQQNGLRLIDLPAHRRRTLLQLQTTLLIDDLKALDYKLSHQASGLNIAYRSLPPRSRLLLWQQAIHFVLGNLQRRPLLAEASANNPEHSAHNQFSKEHKGAFTATLKGLQLVLLKPVSAEQPHTLIQALPRPQATQTELEQLIARAEQPSDTNEPFNDTERQTILDTLVGLQMHIAPKLGNSAEDSHLGQGSTQ